jgi:hypothetical protein
MGDGRAWALRAVTSTDGMMADSARARAVGHGRRLGISLESSLTVAGKAT